MPFLVFVSIPHGKLQGNCNSAASKHANRIFGRSISIKGCQVQIRREVGQLHVSPADVKIRNKQVSLKQLRSSVYDDRFGTHLSRKVFQIHGNIGILYCSACNYRTVKGIIRVLILNKPHQGKSPDIAQD